MTEEFSSVHAFEHRFTETVEKPLNGGGTVTFRKFDYCGKCYGYRAKNPDGTPGVWSMVQGALPSFDNYISETLGELNREGV
ncbi:MAG TPA: hypothetical protein VJI12_04605 [archaeon]|nr:hypothetical protein [archaeon]